MIEIAKLLYKSHSRVLCYKKCNLSLVVRVFVVFCAMPSMMLPFYAIYIYIYITKSLR